jgi:type I restriction enzyme R subunit
VELPGVGTGTDFERFRAKARQFLQGRNDHGAVHKLRFNERLTATDVAELESILVEAGAGALADIDRAKNESYGLGLFLRSLVGLDREAAKRSFDAFLQGKKLAANQIEFINLMVEYLTQRGWMEASSLYESPFTDFSPKGVEGVFESADVTRLIAILNDIREHATA